MWISLLIILTVATAHQIDASITQITPDNFEFKVGVKLPWNSNRSPLSKQWFIMFYSPTCPHCQLAMPFWNQFGQLAYNSSNLTWVNVGAVNCQKHVQMCNELKIASYPTFLYLTKDHQKFKFNGERTKEGFDKFASEAHAGRANLFKGNKTNAKGSDQANTNSKSTLKKPSLTQKIGTFVKHLTAFQIMQLLIIVALSVGLYYLLRIQDDPEDFKRVGFSYRNQDNGMLGLSLDS